MPFSLRSSGARQSVLVRVVVASAFLLLPCSAHALLPIEHWSTAAGARVYFVETHALPILDVGLQFPAGSGRDTTQTSGLASMTLRMLRSGTQELSEDEISTRLADVGAVLSPSLDFDRAGYAVRTLSSIRERTQALEVLAGIVQRPLFSEDVLVRERQRAVAGLKEAEAKPDGVGAKEFARLVYRNHPYALRAGGEPEALMRLSPADLAAFHARFYCATGAVVAIIGDIDRTQAEAIAERLTGSLPTCTAPLPPLPEVAPLTEGVNEAIAHRSAQAHVFIGAPGMRRLDPDYFPLFVGNHILGGGGFNARLYQEVREKRGLSYSVYSYFSPYEQAGAFQIGLQTRKDQADEAVRVVGATLERFIAEGPTATELEAAKQNLVGGFPLRLDSNRKIHDYLFVIGFYRLPLDYLDRFQGNVEAVTVDQIRNAFSRRVDPARLVTVVVGPS